MYTILIFHLFSGCFAVECFVYPLQVCFIPCFSNYILFIFLKRIQSSYPSQSCPFLQLSWHLWPSLMSVQRMQCVFRYSNSGCCRSDRKLVLVWHPPEIQGSFYEGKSWMMFVKECKFPSLGVMKLGWQSFGEHKVTMLGCCGYAQNRSFPGSAFIDL